MAKNSKQFSHVEIPSASKKQYPRIVSRGRSIPFEHYSFSETYIEDLRGLLQKFHRLHPHDNNKYPCKNVFLACEERELRLLQQIVESELSLAELRLYIQSQHLIEL